MSSQQAPPSDPTASEALKPKRPRRTPRIDPAPFELEAEELAELSRKIDVSGTLPHYVRELVTFHDLKVEHIERVPKSSPSVVVMNHCATPRRVGTTGLAEHFMLMLSVLADHTERPPRSLTHLRYYDRAYREPLTIQAFEGLGLVPATLGNGQQVLESGETVLVLPEGRPSPPPYRMHPLYWSFAIMAWRVGVPVVPAVFLGPHEARLRYLKDERQIFMVPKRRNKVPYKIIFLPPLDPRSEIEDIDDRAALSAFCARVRGQMLEAMDRECENRPMVKVARRIQEKFGDPFYLDAAPGADSEA